MHYGHNTYTVATGHVLFYVWLSSLVMQVGGSEGEASRVGRGGLGGPQAPPTAGPPSNGGGSSPGAAYNFLGDDGGGG